MSTPPIMERAPHVVLDRIVRWSSGPLLLFLIVFLVTGYAMSNRYGCGALLDVKAALAIHKLCHLPLVALVMIHSLPAIYLALRRWGWVGGKR